jgi:hypothetical protein
VAVPESGAPNGAAPPDPADAINRVPIGYGRDYSLGQPYPMKGFSDPTKRNTLLCAHSLDNVVRCLHRNDLCEFKACGTQERTVLGVGAFFPARQHQH